MDRFIFDDNGTQADYTTDLENYHGDSVAINYVAGEDALYVGTDCPINSLYFKVTTVNSSAASVNVSYFNGSGFQSMVEVLDETSVGGVTMAKSGHVTMIPNRDQTIGRYDSSEMGEVDQLIYEKYWYKITFDADCAFTIQWAGQIFSNDDDLASEYPDLLRSNVLTSIESGKTGYEEQHMRAAEIIVQELVSRRKINSGEQLLERRALRSMSIAKVAEIVYNMRGEEYDDDRIKAGLEYARRVERDIPYIDSNYNGLADPHEKVVRNGFLRR